MADNFDANKYYCKHEPSHHWELRKKFMELNMGKFPEDRLVCLAQTFANIEFMGCRYPKETMELVEELAFGVVQEYRESQKNRLKRTFVAASDAAGAKVTRGKIKFDQGEDTSSSTGGPLSKRTKLSIDPSDPVSSFILIRLGWEENEESRQCYSIILRSATFCKMNANFSYEVHSGNPPTKTCSVYIDGSKVADATSTSQQAARDEASVKAYAELKKRCYSVLIKNRYLSDGTKVEMDQVESGEAAKSKELPTENVGHKLLRLMGWSGGGLGKDGNKGISEPLTAEAVFERSGFGSGMIKGASKQFKFRIKKIIEDYATSDNPYDLVFTTGFDNEQRKEMHMIARKLGLKSKSYGKDEDRFLTISRKFDAKQIIENLLDNQGETEKYQLIPPAQNST